MSRLNQLAINGIYSYELHYSAEISWMMVDYTLMNRLRYVTYHAYRGDHYRLSAGMLELVEELRHVTT